MSKKQERTEEEWAITYYKHGYQNGQNGDQYINIYRSDTTAFDHYEEGFMDGRENKLGGRK